MPYTNNGVRLAMPEAVKTGIKAAIGSEPRFAIVVDGSGTAHLLYTGSYQRVDLQGQANPPDGVVMDVVYPNGSLATCIKLPNGTWVWF